MNIHQALQKQHERFYELKDHAVQYQLIKDDFRFKIVPAGRRSGKTERAKRYLAKLAMIEPNRTYFAAAPTHNQAKKIWWNDLKTMTGPAHSRDPAESELIIYLLNGTTIHIVGLDKPQRIEGQLWHGGIIDEIADIKPNAWAENILPALNTMNPLEPDYKAWCWLIGVPDGLNHYYDLWDYAISNNDPDWGSYTWKSADILPADVIASAKRSMSARQFQQEFEASFETATGKIYEDYGNDNYTTETIQDHEQLLWFHDFNYTPMSSGIGVIRDRKVKEGRKEVIKHDIYLLDEIILTSAVTTQSALEFCNKFRNHKNKYIMLYGDPAGQAGEKHRQSSDFTAIEEVLKDNGWRWKRKIKRSAPRIKDRQNAVRAKIKNAFGEVSLYVNVENCPYTHKGLATTQLKEGSSFQENETDYQHITTAIGYFIDYDYPIKKKDEVDPNAPTTWGHNIGTIHKGQRTLIK